ncbi:Signal transduction histidine kinase [Abditibacterium utsteinense]|uniref:histidine kinase n=1 Tax=Abditibacterium utsteinense TaxID=1960156 RepID=A0A2S8SVS2_9BACT|nr:response regulator [Abditibacterium utsteinense]PQV64888.1 Signal transduction histidine kinase [Abditibacterium utsteinense]
MSLRTLRVLLVEDNPTDALLVEVALEEMTTLAPQMTHVELLGHAQEVLQNAEFDIVLLDLSLPDGRGLENFERLQRVAPSVPIIVLTGSADGDLGTEAIARGAADYLMKGVTDAALLERSARYAIERKKNENDRLEMARLQIARDEAQANNRAKDEFLATLSHELRTPLNAIMGWASLLKTGQLDEQTSAQAIDTIERNARVQAQLIEDLLDVSRIIAGNFKLELSDVNLESIVRAAANTLLPSMQIKKIALEIRVEGTSSVRGDAMRLQQVTWNLISNAIKFSPEGGQICVTLSQQKAPDLAESTKNEGEENEGREIVLRIEDQGMGIAPEFLPHVFERFRQADGSTTRRHGGLGLGLAIVRNVVELHGGRVRVQSEGEGQGANFSVFLPAAPHQQARATLHACDPDAPAWTGVSILAVDEEEETRDFIRLLFEARGAKVETASTARAALESIEDKVPHLLIINSEMPAAEGLHLLETARSRGLTFPAIALASSPAGGGAERALSAGFGKFLAKPLDAKSLCRAAATLLQFES